LVAKPGGAFNLLTSSQTLAAPNGVPVQIWSLTPNTAPAVYHNATTNTATSDGGQGVFPPGTTWFYAGENGAPQNFGVIRLTIPAGKDGTYRLESAVRPYLNGPPGNDTDYHVLKNNVELFSQVVPLYGSAGYSNEVSLVAGDTIDFVIGRGLDNNNSGLKIEARLISVSGGGGLSLVVPTGLETRNGSGATGTLDVSHRLQEVYEASMFPAQPIRITEIRFRPNVSLGNAFSTTIGDIQINMSTTAREADALSSSFVQNVGSDDTTVFHGSLSISSSFSGPAQGPKDFDVIVPLQTPFTYDPSRGNLLLDIRNFSGSGAAKMDGEGATMDGASRLISLNVNGASGNLDSAADVLQIIYTSSTPQSPLITSQPQNRTVVIGQTASFNVTAFGTPPLTYQWRHDGTPIGGATSSTLAISNVQSSDAGIYSVVVANASGSVTSSDAGLTITDAGALVVPTGLETRNGSGATGTLDVRHRLQEVYGASMFPGQPIQITQIRFRPNIVLGHAFSTTVSNIQINMSTSSRGLAG